MHRISLNFIVEEFDLALQFHAACFKSSTQFKIGIVKTRQQTISSIHNKAAMKSNLSPVNGVLHQQQSAPNYQLRRYFPCTELKGLVEQFWFVDWCLPDNKAHTQRNLPDPNFHLLLSTDEIKIIGPVSKVYDYTMHGKGQILGVKFRVGALVEQFDITPLACVDKTFSLEHLCDVPSSSLISSLTTASDDAERVTVLSQFLMPFALPLSTGAAMAEDILNTLQDHSDIFTVEQLAEHCDMPIRKIQRLCQHYIGFSPKWLIRKYRLHQALALLESDAITMADIVAQLDYTDQSHLIRDFKEIIGTTPNRYLKRP
ncbi:AraC family transcriptional regulator [Pseudoalteromonas piscicida]|uniref:AraC family transcriptional regulator n=2 Tax=Pseudoalteromonas piscicida TaxID=43662 RepID=A0A2A5JP04_PSEO7|nr:AraC family transcriptional regulator [Pseudoalteromonas piscicida]